MPPEAGPGWRRFPAEPAVPGWASAARHEVFATCRRVALPGRPGEAVLLHRLLVHGVAPWEEGARAPSGARVVACFRPLLADPALWLAAP